MQLLEEELKQYTEFTWTSILGLEVQPASAPYKPDRNKDVCASVHITGSWKGMVVLNFHECLANIAAEKMFGLSGRKADPEEIADAAGELINTIGGNMKALLPQPCFLSLPIVAMNGHVLYFPSTKAVCKAVFDSGGQQFKVTILQNVEKSFLKKTA